MRAPPRMQQLAMVAAKAPQKLLQVAMIAAADVPTRPLDLDLAGPLALRGWQIHQSALRREARPGLDESERDQVVRIGLVRRRCRVLDHYREALARRGSFS